MPRRRGDKARLGVSGPAETSENRAKGIPTSAEAAARVLEQKRDGWHNPRHPRELLSSLSRFAIQA